MTDDVFDMAMASVIFALAGGILALLAGWLRQRVAGAPAHGGFALLVAVGVVIATYLLLAVALAPAPEGDHSLRHAIEQVARLEWQAFVLLAIEGASALLVARRFVPRRAVKVDPRVFD